MTLLNSSLATEFLAQYKKLLSEVAGKALMEMDLEDFEMARRELYEKNLNKTYSFANSYDPSFIDAVRSATYGMFIYAKKYRQGYALKSSDGTWHCVKALTTPLEELLPADWVVIDTAILTFGGSAVCDGLVINRNMFIGKNMINTMIQELKGERRKWSSHKKMQRIR